MIKEIIDKAEYCGTFWKKFKGLMFSKQKVLIFDLRKKTKFQAMVHTCFVFYPIDVYWLDENKRIIDKRLNVAPFRFVIPKKEAYYILEKKH